MGRNLNNLWRLGILIGLLSCNTDQSKSDDSALKDQASPSQKSVLSNKNERHIVFFGNSLTAGYGLEETEAFPALLQNRLDSLGLPYVAVNAGLSGETSSGGLNRIDWVLNQPMDIFVLELGANDALRGLELGNTKTNLQGIIDKVRGKHPGIPIILAGMKAPPNMGGEYADQFNELFGELSLSNKVDLIPFLLEGVAGNTELNFTDGIHPNAIGQKIVLENVWSVLEQHLNDAE